MSVRRRNTTSPDLLAAGLGVGLGRLAAAGDADARARRGEHLGRHVPRALHLIEHTTSLRQRIGRRAQG